VAGARRGMEWERNDGSVGGGEGRCGGWGEEVGGGVGGGEEGVGGGEG
jgi:hypothetical protein